MKNDENIPKVAVVESLNLISTVRVGDVIKSPSFKNLLFRDLKDLDALVGFEVNPYIHHKNWDNTRSVLLESFGLIQRNLAFKKDLGRPEKKYLDYKIAIDAEREFVVIFTYRNVNFHKEYTSEDDRNGHYPLTVVAKMLSPEGEWDDHGIEIWFNMESAIATHCVNEVISTGFMSFNKIRF